MGTALGIALLVLIVVIAFFVIATETGAAVGAGIGALLAVAGFPMLVLAGIASIEGWDSGVWDAMGWAGGFGVVVGGGLFVLVSVFGATE